MRGLACIKCRVFYIPKKNGACVEEGMPLTNDNKGPWGPYKLWICDLAECPSCGHQIACGFGGKPVSEHFHEDYKEKVEKYDPIVRIDACAGYKP